MVEAAGFDEEKKDAKIATMNMGEILLADSAITKKHTKGNPRKDEKRSVLLWRLLVSKVMVQLQLLALQSVTIH